MSSGDDPSSSSAAGSKDDSGTGTKRRQRFIKGELTSLGSILTGEDASRGNDTSGRCCEDSHTREPLVVSHLWWRRLEGFIVPATGTSRLSPRVVSLFLRKGQLGYLKSAST